MSNENKLGQEPAFPTDPMNSAFSEWNGMSKRFYAVCQILPGIISGKGSAGLNELRDNYMERSVELAFKYADEVLKQEIQ